MERKDIKTILKTPYPDILDFALSLVKLTDKELEAITYVDIKGNTEERTAEILDVSPRHIQDLRARAYKKLSKIWSSHKFINIYLEMEKKD